MASSHGTPPVFTNKIVAWIDYRLPIFSYIEKEYHTFPTPRNFNYFWNFGAIATVMLVLMIATGIVLATNYTPQVLMAFDSVERVIRGLGGGAAASPIFIPELQVVWLCCGCGCGCAAACHAAPCRTARA